MVDKCCFSTVLVFVNVIQKMQSISLSVVNLFLPWPSMRPHHQVRIRKMFYYKVFLSVLSFDIEIILKTQQSSRKFRVNMDDQHFIQYNADAY